jgi:hypothetical protein
LLVVFRSIICLLVTTPLNVTTQVSVPAPLKALLLHDNPVSCTAPNEATGRQAAKRPIKPARNSSRCRNPSRLRPASSGLWEEISSAAHLRPKGGGKRRTCIDGTSRSALAHATCTRAHWLCGACGHESDRRWWTKYLLTDHPPRCVLVTVSAITMVPYISYLRHKKGTYKL